MLFRLAVSVAPPTREPGLDTRSHVGSGCWRDLQVYRERCHQIAHLGGRGLGCVCCHDAPSKTQKTGHSLSGHVRRPAPLYPSVSSLPYAAARSITMTGFGLAAFRTLNLILVPGDIRPTNNKCLHVGHRSSCIGSGGALLIAHHLPPAAVHTPTPPQSGPLATEAPVLRAQFLTSALVTASVSPRIAYRRAVPVSRCRTRPAGPPARRCPHGVGYVIAERLRLRLSREANA